MHELRCRLFNSIDDVDPADWERVQSASAEPIFMDRRFIAAVEAGMRHGYTFWHAIVYDKTNVPLACACLSAGTIDLANMADPRLVSIVKHLWKVMPWLRYARILTCGLPVSTGKSSLTLAARGQSRQLLSTLDAAVSELAARTRMDAVLYKELGQMISIGRSHCWRPDIDASRRRPRTICSPCSRAFTSILRH